MKRVFLFLILGLACMAGVTGCGEENKEPGNVPLTGITTDRDEKGISLNVRYGTASDNMKFYPVPLNATDVDFSLSSANTSIAVIEETALGESRVTVLKPGSTFVTVSSGKVKKEIPVTGRFDVTSLDTIRLELEIEPVSGTDSTMTFAVSVGDIVRVKATPSPQNANTDTTDYVIFDWKSSNPSVATVEEDAETTTAIDKFGIITVVGTGEARITITCGKAKRAKTVIISVATGE
jgi:uncharacterized protein YjdB